MDAKTEHPIAERQARARAWFEHLRDDICAAFETLEDELPPNAPLADRAEGRLVRTPWQRTDHSGEQGGGALHRRAGPDGRPHGDTEVGRGGAQRLAGRDQLLGGDLDLVLVMSVNPGFGGQSFIESQLDKIAAARKRIDATGRDIALEVDGGITPETARRAIAAGATVLVAGTSVFQGGPSQYAANISALRG